MNDTLRQVLILVPILLLSISIHETMHAVAGLWLGDDTAKDEGRISLNPLRHIDPFLTIGLPILMVILHGPVFGMAKPVNIDMRRVKYEEFGGAIIGMIGPLTNLLIAIVAAILFRSFESLQVGLASEILGTTIILNIGFFVFNSIPYPPLDGSRLLYAFAPTAIQNAMDFIEQQGIFGFFIFMYLFYSFLQPVLSKIIYILTNGLLG